MIKDSDRRVFCIGETVLDIIFSGNKPLCAKPGGSMFNAAVSMARSGLNVFLISELFRDDPGRIILDVLRENQISTAFISQYDQGNTPVALAFLNEAAQAEYTFYKNYPAERFPMELPAFRENDIVLFGSFFSLISEVRDNLVRLLTQARKNNALIIYDPNFRKQYMEGLPETLPRILGNIRFADIVRGSDEDFLHIFATNDPAEVFGKIQNENCKTLVYTSNGSDVLIFDENRRFSFPVEAIIPVSTVGAGDAFNAGLISGIVKSNVGRYGLHQLSSDQWKVLADHAIRFSGEVCRSLENYVSLDFAP
jgi:fructokinase